MKISFVLVLFLTLQVANSQSELKLSFWSDVMMNANSSENRNIAAKKFEAGFQKIIESDNAFDYDFSEISQLTIVSDSLNTFKVISWFNEGEDKSFNYSGYILKKDGNSFKLKDAYSSLEDLEYVNLGSEEWIGGIYYNIVEANGKNYIFSYRQNSKFEKVKIFDCLSFDDDGTPILGDESFVYPQTDARDIVKNRIVFKYSGDAILSLNYNNDMKMVVHDHLASVMGRMEGQGPTLVPDGTYEGFVFREGNWIYEEKLFNHTYQEAPRPKQILGKGDKDVFGKPANANTKAKAKVKGVKKN